MGELFDSNSTKVLSFADMVKGKKQLPTTSVDLNMLPKHIVKDGKPALVIPRVLFFEGCEIWKYSLIGRLDFKDLDFTDVKKNLLLQWGLDDGRVQFGPMNRGFFIIKLWTQDDKEKIFREDKNWLVAQQSLKLQEWYPSFNADKQVTSHSTVWVKFPGLPVELWMEKTVLSLGQTLGTPIIVDKRTLNHEYGYFASVLVDIDFAELDSE
ncbi:uncharacterized protein LOC113342809, partial [Papaver somniferum]|uniref:uncharacterized protein LOC113342809 n=1 Tax=Papaver somniferum TaxID=3469 RepID=UPI000E7047E4